MTRIITMDEREATALAERRSALAAAQGKLAQEAALHGGHYRVFGSVARDEVHPRSDLDLLAEFPRANAPRAIRAAEGICRELGVPCDIIDKAVCSPDFLGFVLPGSKRLG